MRTARLAIVVFFLAASLFLLCRSITSARPGAVLTSAATFSSSSASAAPARSLFGSFFLLSAPFTLFPPNAAISLTDDNSTTFPARPAGFGPPLAPKGLSGQLWIGSGFAEDTLQDGEGLGEFGCSDVPGWDGSVFSLRLDRKASSAAEAVAVARAITAKAAAGTSPRLVGLEKGPLVDRTAASDPAPELPPRALPVDDGTDDYLHEALQPVGAKTAHDGSGPLSSSSSGHADIQSMQETAEITGKVVLLRRGGCGFLEKVKWAQRRGAVAVIVGDNRKGGPLIQMYASGDTSNVSIPAIFTGHTTAHLLSSLMQPGSYIEDTVDEKGNAALKVQPSDRPRKNKKANKQHQATTTTAAPLAKATAGKGKKTPPAKKHASTGTATSTFGKKHGGSGSSGGGSGSGWLSRMLPWSGRSGTVSEKSRPPSSGRLDWVLVDDWSDEKDKVLSTSMEKAATKDGGSSGGNSGGNPQQHQHAAAAPPLEDSFQIGVQDWRDPDLVGSPREKRPGSSSSSSRDDSGGTVDSITDTTPGGSTRQTGPQALAADANGPKGGSITPGSGEYSSDTGGYGRPGSSSSSSLSASKVSAASGSAGQDVNSNGNPTGGLLSKLFGDDDGADFAQQQQQKQEQQAAKDGTTRSSGGSSGSSGGGSSSNRGGTADITINTPVTAHDDADDDSDAPAPPDHHDGLWVTITPTHSGSPLTDALLVLVVSPLVTLSIVYALLMLRARLRRRRWRAPKSIVARLPVRTYHTIAPSSASSSASSPPASPHGAASPRIPSPASASSPSTPLLQRPRSRTATGVPDADDLLRLDAALQMPLPLSAPSPPSARDHASSAADPHVSSEWRKHMGRQVECVVCLEEYVDGVSRVMSLPCGHEFHVECITPWLTTRRRTCPICKGDVVRSLARGSPSQLRGGDAWDDDSDMDFDLEEGAHQEEDDGPLPPPVVAPGPEMMAIPSIRRPRAPVRAVRAAPVRAARPDTPPPTPHPARDRPAVVRPDAWLSMLSASLLAVAAATAASVSPPRTRRAPPVPDARRSE